MLTLPISKKRFYIAASGKIPGDYVKAGRYQDIGFSSEIISGKE